MTTIRQIVVDAFREGGITQVGVTPEADEFDEGLRKVQTIVSGLYGNEMGAPLVSVNYGNSGLVNPYAKEQDLSPEIDSGYVPVNLRLMVNIDTPKTVYLDPNPQDGARLSIVDVAENFETNTFTVDANGRRIESETSVTLNTDGDNKEWFYRADLGEWTLISNLTANSQSPFPSEYDDFLITLTAMRLNPRYQAQTAPETIDALNRTRKSFRARYKQVTEMAVEEGLRRMSSNKFWLSNTPSLSNHMFARGRVV